jgi:hypothetical protein
MLAAAELALIPDESWLLRQATARARTPTTTAALSVCCQQQQQQSKL